MSQGKDLISNDVQEVAVPADRKLPLAVSSDDLRDWGCPNCGYRSGSMPMSYAGCGAWKCGDCQEDCIVLGKGVTASNIATFGGYYPKLSEHPRKGTPAHGRADTKPPVGEHFWSRGTGTDRSLGCFICAGPDGYYSNIAAFVQCEAAGIRIVAMFERKGTRLDLRKHEPDHLQVKIGACNDHFKNLQALHMATKDKFITAEMIATCKALV